MAITATDDEAYATQLWGDKKSWDEDRKQFVPTEDSAEQDEAQPVDEPANGQGTGQGDVEDEQPYEDWSGAKLDTELEARQLSKAGSKADKAKRLRDNDEATGL